MTTEEADKVRASNEIIRSEREKKADEEASKFSNLKRNFLSAPIRKAIKLNLEKKDMPMVQIDYRTNESYWVSSKGT